MKKKNKQDNSLEIIKMMAERDALVERKKAAWLAGDTAEHLRCIGRIAEIEAYLMDANA